MQVSAAYQIVSIEPTQPLQHVIDQVADRHALQANFGATRQFNAPVCGIEYHIQEFFLADKDGGMSTAHTIEKCLQEIESLTDQAMADGYCESL